ncbi:hypothetical protein CRENBAI_025470 [Crenichthys baileyi]|uniref:Uncharacterized protein n=1 Tax=Crenichthys baileyi TaxID=28760 RepID=A0AAV9SMC8_9TELE
MPLDLSHTPSFQAHAETLSTLQRTKPPPNSKTNRLLDLTPSRTKTLHSTKTRLIQFLRVPAIAYYCFSTNKIVKLSAGLSSCMVDLHQPGHL